MEHQIIQSLAGERFFLPAPIVIGEGLIPARIRRAMSRGWDSGTFDHRPIQMIEIEDACVTGQGLVLSRDGSIIAESITQHSEKEVDEATSSFPRLRREATVVPGRHVLARKRGDHNYGHWLVECLPKPVLAAESSLPFDGIIVPDMSGPMAAVIADSLHLLDLDRYRITHASATGAQVFERLVLVDGLTTHGSYMSPLALGHLETMRTGQPGSALKRILIRRPDGPRRISNEDALCRALVPHGFIPVNPAQLSLRQQISLLKDADVVIGALGAGLTNVVFAHRGALVINLAPATMPDTFFYFLAAHRQQRYVEIRSPLDDPARNRASDFSVDVDAVLHTLHAELARSWK